jgi:two-component system, NtrC family, nitrogen regulation sensor histidine kinase NtrY
MVYKDFKVKLLSKIILISIAIGMGFYFYFQNQIPLMLLFGAFTAYAIYNLYHYLLQVNRKLSQFLEAIKYSDFTIQFSKDNELGKSFRKLNQNFNEVLEAFRNARSEKEENFHYLQTIVQHVTIGILSYDHTGSVELFNNAACRMLETPRIKNLSELENKHPQLCTILNELKSGNSALYRKSLNQELAIYTTEIKLRGKYYKIISLQNIHDQLQQKELEAWQNLSKVLRHEIMNSITPIASLVGTLRLIVDEDLVVNEENAQAIDDISSGLQTIETRSKGLINFVDAYRNFTSIPQPNKKMVAISDLLSKVHRLMVPDALYPNIELTIEASPPDSAFLADPELIEMVLINLIKNAREAIGIKNHGKIWLKSYIKDNGNTIIEVNDNGPGVVPGALEQIFIPFYSTKKEGSGIGLAISRQIMLMHNGYITLQSEPHTKTTFTLTF